MDFEIGSQKPELVNEFHRRHRTGVVTLVFTDMVGSTALKQQLGDRAAADLFRKHHELVRQTLRRFQQAEEIETAGDSFMLVFATPSDAVEFALLLRKGLLDSGQPTKPVVLDRIGIHLGEVVVSRGEQSPKPMDLFGIQIDTCARVMSLAQAGQVLMTRAVFDNARQVLKGEDTPGVGPLEWLNHGPYSLKGLDETVEICEVRELKTGLPPQGPPPDSEKAHRKVSADEEPILGWRPALEQPVPGTKWTLEKKLGEGGFGEVWLGRHETLKEKRVFKFCFRADRVRALKREVTLFRVMKEKIGQHPNIVGIQEVFFDQAPYYIVMDYSAGQDLRAWCESQGGVGKVPPNTRLEIVAQVADALEAAHKAGVIHRDVKPSNILISEGGVRGAELETGRLSLSAKLTDFGIGQVVSQEALDGITRSGFTQTMVGPDSSSQTGTQIYMAPELLAGQKPSARSDIYSLGVVLYQLLIGDFARPLATDWAKNIQDPLLRNDLERCFAENPQERFENATELATGLRDVEKRRSECAKRQAAIQEQEKATHRRKTTGIAVAIAVLFGLLAVLSIVWWRQFQKHSQALALYYMGRDTWNNNRDAAHLRTAISYFQEAVALDPNCALAHSGLADAYSSYALSFVIGRKSPKEMMPQAIKEVQIALRLDPSLAESHCSWAVIKLFYEYDWSGAETEFKRAIALSKGTDGAHHWYSHYLMARGRIEESARESKLALERDSRDQMLGFHLAWHYFYAGAEQYDKALEALKALEAVNPINLYIPRYRAHILLRRGDPQATNEFREAFARTEPFGGSPEVKAEWGYACAKFNQPEKARQLIKDLEQLNATGRYVSSYDFAVVYAGLGQTNLAFKFLNQAVEERDDSMINLAREPMFDDLHPDPGWHPLLRKMGLEK